jgi:pimeloyl-ACP methyl ester carboxylesterase
MGDSRWLPYLGTEQALEDLELFRQAMGDDRIWLYGESYGTQLAQTYAAAHPEHLAGLILDGPVDLTLTGLEYFEEQAAAFSDVLGMTLAACAEDEACAEDFSADPAAAYDRLAARLSEGPLSFDFPLASGGLAERTIAFADLETAAAGYVYSETARMIFLRALAAAEASGDLVPLARVLYSSLLGSRDGGPVIDPTYSDASTMRWSATTTTTARLKSSSAGDPGGGDPARSASIFYGGSPRLLAGR